jgi:glycosyltransferase involved in cell wall biosynthesis
MNKARVIFVGGFSTSADGLIGGGVAACRSLLASGISSVIDWRLLDSTMRSLPPPPLAVRAYDAAVRLLRFIWMLITAHANTAFILVTYDKTSFLEKGVMALLAHWFRKRVVLYPISEIRPGAIGILEPFVRFVVRRCDAIVCQSETARANLEAIARSALRQAQVIPNWIDAIAYRMSEPRTLAQTPTILFLGWIERFKGVYELLDAAAQLADEGISFGLELCGGGSELDPLRTLVHERGLDSRVTFHGWVHGQAKIDRLRQADIFVLPSYSEGMPNALMEAMATGLPVVATPVGGIPVLVDEGVNGLLVAPRDVPALAHALRTLIEDPQRRAAMGAESRRRIETEYDIDRIWPILARALGAPVEQPPNP